MAQWSAPPRVWAAVMGLTVVVVWLNVSSPGPARSAPSVAFPRAGGPRTPSPAKPSGLVDAADGNWSVARARRALAARDAATEAALKEQFALLEAVQKTQDHLANQFQINKERLSEVHFYDETQGGDKIVQRLLRALVLRDSFVYVVGGMSDTAAHGNYFEDSYPLVMKAVLQEVMEQAKIKFDVRNMAMGGVPSYPGSMCMADAFGKDADVVMWDYRMTEHDALRGEIFIRQALMHPRRPAVAFKRLNAYLKSLKAYFEPASLHAIDERALVKFASLVTDARARDMTQNDTFCSPQPDQNTAPGEDPVCPCPGKVRWHAQHKLHRLRGVHMAMVLLRQLEQAVHQYVELLHAASVAEVQARDWALPPPADPASLPAPRDQNGCNDLYCSAVYHCATSWTPGKGPTLEALLDSDTQWVLDHPSKRAKSITEQGHRECHYQDAKLAYIGDVNSGWIFFKFTSTDGRGAVAFCATFPADVAWEEQVLVLLNGEEIQGELATWIGADTLGVHLGCYSHSDALKPGENTLGFRVMDNDLTMQVSHVLWS